MSKHIAVRLSDERERRRAIAAGDAEILARTGQDPELAGLAEHALGLPSELTRCGRFTLPGSTTLGRLSDAIPAAFDLD